MSYIDRVGNVDYAPYRPSLNPAFVRAVMEKRAAERRQEVAKAAKAEVKAIVAETKAIEAKTERQHSKSDFTKLMRKRHVPSWVADIILEAAEKHSVSPSEIMSPSRSKRVVQARSEALYRVKDRSPCVSFPKIGKWFARDHTSVMHSVANFADLNGYPQLCGYDIKRLRVRNAQISADRRRQHSDRET